MSLCSHIPFFFILNPRKCSNKLRTIECSFTAVITSHIRKFEMNVFSFKCLRCESVQFIYIYFDIWNKRQSSDTFRIICFRTHYRIKIQNLAIQILFYQTKIIIILIVINVYDAYKIGIIKNRHRCVNVSCVYNACMKIFLYVSYTMYVHLCVCLCMCLYVYCIYRVCAVWRIWCTQTKISLHIIHEKFGTKKMRQWHCIHIFFDQWYDCTHTHTQRI